MRRPALYSRSERPQQAPTTSGPVMATAPAVAARPSRLRAFAASPRALWAAIAVLALLLVLALSLALRPGQRRITQEDINAAVLKTLTTTNLPSAAARAVASAKRRFTST